MSGDLYAFRRNVVLVASAGTGKTHALVGVLLHALLGVSELSREPVDPARIAATTFSRKAAAEIRERLVTELERLAFDAPSAHTANLDEAARRLGVSWAPDVRAQRARHALAVIDRATISTLHGLAYGIARTHALAVGLAPSLGVASEDDNEAWANDAVAFALNDHAGRDADAVRDLFRLLRGGDRAQAELVRLLLALDDDGRAAPTLALPDDSERATSTATLVRDVLSHAQTHLADLHARAGAVGFGATLRLARDALRDDPPAAARASAAYDALLVDEFQDTSRVQVELLRLLWQRSARSREPGTMPAFGDLRETGLLVVGDRKQSIYAFRGADVGVFVTACIEIAGEKARVALGVADGVVSPPSRTTGDFFALRENHRANGGLIAFVNTFSRECLRAESEELFEARYVEEVESLVPAPDTRTIAPCVTWLRPPGEPRDTTRIEDATIAAAFIAASAGRESGDDGSRLAFRDFAVLAQSSAMLDAAAFALARAGIPHVTAGRGFFAAREVQDLLAILRWIDRPGDRAALLSVLRGPCAALSDRTLLGLTEPHRGLVTSMERWDTLDRRALVEDDDREALTRVRVVLRALQRSAESLGPGRTLREAVRELDLEQTWLLLPRGVQRLANVRKLMRMADDATTIRVLLERVARAEARAREPEVATFSEDDDAVRLLTLHASKGLAFRVVLIPELKGAPIRSQNTTLGIDLRAEPAWIATKVLDDDGEPMATPSLQRLTEMDRRRLRADRRRAMYVAVTRARERLVFIGGVKATRRAERPSPSFGAVVTQLARAGAIETREAITEVPVVLSARGEGPEMTLLPKSPRTGEVSLAPTALQDFRHCARRFELVHLIGLPEPTPRALGRFHTDGMAQANARAEGEALHEVLERIDPAAFGGSADGSAAGGTSQAPADGSAAGGTSHTRTVDVAAHVRRALAACRVSLDAGAQERVVRGALRFLDSQYARSMRDAKETWRERSFVVTLESPAMTLTLRGAMDLVVVWPSGDVDVVDYKSARGPDVRTAALQLDVYAYAAQVQLGTTRVRAGAVFLGSDGPEPRFRPHVKREVLEAELLELAARLASARTAASYPRAAPKTCHAIGCGYFSLCHPAREKRQLTLFP